MFLLRIILWILGNSAALWLAVQFLPSITFIGRIEDWIIAGLILGLANLVLKPILKLVAGPFIIVTFGLALILVQGIILWITRLGLLVTTGASLNFDVPWGYIWGAILIGIANLVFAKARRILASPTLDDNQDNDVHDKLKTIDSAIEDLRRHHQETEGHDDDEDDDEDEDEDEDDEDDD